MTDETEIRPAVVESDNDAPRRGRPPKVQAPGAGVNAEPGMPRANHANEPEKNDRLLEAERAEKTETETVEVEDGLDNDGKPKAVVAKAIDEVLVRITKKGHGKVFRGDMTMGMTDATYGKGEIVALGRANAEDLEERGFVEIED